MGEQNGVGGLDRSRGEPSLPMMRVLRIRARTTNLARAAQLGSAIDAAAEGRLDDAGQSYAVAVAHQLIGSAGTFGYAQASERAVLLKEFFAGRDFDTIGVTRAREWLSALELDLTGDGSPADD